MSHAKPAPGKLGERLRRGDLVHEMQIDVEVRRRRLARRHHNVIVPDLLEHRQWASSDTRSDRGIGDRGEGRVIDRALCVARRLDLVNDLVQLLIGDGAAECLEALPDGVAAGVLAEHEARAVGADGFGSHDLVGRTMLEHPVLMNARFVGKCIRADDRLVRRYRDTGASRDEPRARHELSSLDLRVAGEERASRGKCHHDFLERCIPRPFAEAVDRTLDLSRTGANAGERVGNGKSEVVVTVGGDDDIPARRGEPANTRDQLGVFLGRRIADGIGNVEGRRPRLDRGRERLIEKARIGTRGVLGREFDVVGE